MIVTIPCLKYDTFAFISSSLFFWLHLRYVFYFFTSESESNSERWSAFADTPAALVTNFRKTNHCDLTGPTGPRPKAKHIGAVCGLPTSHLSHGFWESATFRRQHNQNHHFALPEKHLSSNPGQSTSSVPHLPHPLHHKHSFPGLSPCSHVVKVIFGDFASGGNSTKAKKHHQQATMHTTPSVRKTTTKVATLITFSTNNYRGPPTGPYEPVVI